MVAFLRACSRQRRAPSNHFWSCTFGGGRGRFIFGQRFVFEDSDANFWVMSKFLTTASIEMASCFFAGEGRRPIAEQLRFFEEVAGWEGVLKHWTTETIESTEIKPFQFNRSVFSLSFRASVFQPYPLNWLQFLVILGEFRVQYRYHFRSDCPISFAPSGLFLKPNDIAPRPISTPIVLQLFVRAINLPGVI